LNGPDRDDTAVRFTIRQMTIGIAVIGVVLALAVQVPRLLIAGLDVVLIAFGIYKLGQALGLVKHGNGMMRPPAWFRIVVAVSVLILLLGVVIGLLFPVHT
jgi:uncharacterized membrane protein